MKKIFICLFSLAAISGSVFAQANQPLQAAMGKVKLNFMLDAGGRPSYSVYFGDKPVINNSFMGIKLLDDTALTRNFQVTGSEKSIVDDSWVPVWGEVNKIRDHYQQLTVHLKQQGPQARLLNIIFRVFDDGVGFRYEFPKMRLLLDAE